MRGKRCKVNCGYRSQAHATVRSCGAAKEQASVCDDSSHSLAVAEKVLHRDFDPQTLRIAFDRQTASVHRDSERLALPGGRTRPWAIATLRIRTGNVGVELNAKSFAHKILLVSKLREESQPIRNRGCASAADAMPLSGTLAAKHAHHETNHESLIPRPKRRRQWCQAVSSIQL